MQRQITVSDLLDALRERLKLRIVTGEAGLHHIIFDTTREKSGHIIAGPLNYIHPTPVQIIGPTEKRYLTSLSSEEQANALERLFAASPAAILITNRQNAFCAILNCDNRRFAQYDAAILDIHQGIGGTEIDTDIIRKQP